MAASCVDEGLADERRKSTHLKTNYTALWSWGTQNDHDGRIKAGWRSGRVCQWNNSEAKWRKPALNSTLREASQQ
jgi:hypothetical protein